MAKKTKKTTTAKLSTVGFNVDHNIVPIFPSCACGRNLTQFFTLAFLYEHNRLRKLDVDPLYLSYIKGSNSPFKGYEPLFSQLKIPRHKDCCRTHIMGALKTSSGVT